MPSQGEAFMFSGKLQTSGPALGLATAAPELEEEAPGSFTEEGTALRALFTDPDGRGSRKWRDMFDPAACEEADLEAILSHLPKL